MVAASFSSWMTVTYGGLDALEAVKEMVVGSPGTANIIPGWGEIILNKVQLDRKVRRAELVMVSPAELGLGTADWRDKIAESDARIPLEEILAAGVQAGLRKCQPDLAPYLRAQCVEQRGADGEWTDSIYFAMDPVEISADECPSGAEPKMVFRLASEQCGLGLSGSFCGGGYLPDAKFIFERAA